MALGRQLIALGYRLALPHGNDHELATSQAIAAALYVDDEHNGDGRGGIIVWPRLPLDELTQHLARCAGVIGVDSGLSHMAVALDLPHVQIYNFDTAWRTGPLAGADGAGGQRQLSVYAQPTPSVQLVWNAWLKCQPSRSPVSERAPLL